jgi:predicted dehydrogenase
MQQQNQAGHKLRLGIVGLGHLGKIHLKCALESGCWHVQGVFDTDSEAIHKTQELYPELKVYANLDDLMRDCDAIDLVTPTHAHFAAAKRAISLGKHVFIEKPITHTVAEARTLVRMQAKSGVKVQVGHVERFNPAFLALQGVRIKPRFVEIHRLAMYQPRGTDVSVVLDLMIHDLDLLLHIMGNEIKSVHASGVRLLSATEDIANVRIEMFDGAVANLTASRISLKQMRKVRIFQEDAYVTMDFLEKKAQIVTLHNEQPETNAFPLETPLGTKYIGMQMPEVLPVNAIKQELISFHDAIKNNTETIVTAADGLAALSLAHRILRAMRRKAV